MFAAEDNIDDLLKILLTNRVVAGLALAGFMYWMVAMRSSAEVAAKVALFAFACGFAFYEIILGIVIFAIIIVCLFFLLRTFNKMAPDIYEARDNIRMLHGKEEPTALPKKRNPRNKLLREAEDLPDEELRNEERDWINRHFSEDDDDFTFDA